MDSPIQQWMDDAWAYSDEYNQAMTLIIPPGFAQFDFETHSGHDGKECHTLIGADLVSGFTQLELTNLSTAVAPIFKSVLGELGRYEGVRALIGTDGGDPEQLESTSGNGAGTITNALSTPQVQGLIRKRGVLAGRKNQGRTFLPDIVESEVDPAGILNSTAMTRHAAFATNLLAVFRLGTNGLTNMVILHSDATVPSIVTAYTAQAKVATLRPRYDR